MTKLKITAALFSLAATASPALAQDFVDITIQELVAQGYTHFEVSRGLLSTEIDAYGPNFTNLEIQLSNADGNVISVSSEVESQAEYEQNISEINQISSNIREGEDASSYGGEEIEDADDDRSDNEHTSGFGSDDSDSDQGSEDYGNRDNDSYDNDESNHGDHDGGERDGDDHNGDEHDGDDD